MWLPSQVFPRNRRNSSLRIRTIPTIPTTTTRKQTIRQNRADMLLRFPMKASKKRITTIRLQRKNLKKERNRKSFLRYRKLRSMKFQRFLLPSPQMRRWLIRPTLKTTALFPIQPITIFLPYSTSPVISTNRQTTERTLTRETISDSSNSASSPKRAASLSRTTTANKKFHQTLWIETDDDLFNPQF